MHDPTHNYESKLIFRVVLSLICLIKLLGTEKWVQLLLGL